MHRQALLVELGALDRAGGLLDAEADEARGGDGQSAEGAGVDFLARRAGLWSHPTPAPPHRGEGRVCVVASPIEGEGRDRSRPIPMPRFPLTQPSPRWGEG